MTMISDLSGDLVEEILSMVPITSLRTLRSTCKQWNALSKVPSFTKKHHGKAGKEILLIMAYDSRVCLMSVNLHNHKDGLFDPSLKNLGKFNDFRISKVFHCDGFLLCLTRNDNRLVVWNPYLGQTRWIKPSNNSHRLLYNFAFGYDNNNNNKNHKVLSFLYRLENHLVVEYEIYDFNSNSWKILDVTFNWDISCCGHRRVVSLNGNAYFVAQEREKADKDKRDFLLCFDFTRERFGPSLHLPFHSCIKDSVILSTVREEQLAVLLHRRYSYEIEVWITTKIEPDAVSWSNLFKVDRKLFNRRCNGTFVVDEKKKIAVICDHDREKWTNYKAYMIGEGGYYGEEDLGESICLPLLCSYVSSSAQIQGKEKNEIFN